MSKFIPEPDAKAYDDIWERQVALGKQAKYNNRYAKLHATLAESLAPHDIVLEVGCGMGHFTGNYIAPTCLDFLATDYSPKAIEIAKKTFPLIANKFEVFDPLLGNGLRSDRTSVYRLLLSHFRFNTIVALEFLEHIDQDIEFITSIESGVKVIFSLPLNEKQKSGYPPGTPKGYGLHRRIYTLDSIHERYGKLIDIQLVQPVRRKPALWTTLIGHKR